MEDWTKKAANLGFASETEMWAVLYFNQAMPISALAEKLKVSKTAVRHRLAACKIPTRGQGGANNSRNLGWRFRHFDPRWVAYLPLSTLAFFMDSTANTVYKLKQQFFGGRTDGIRTDRTNTTPGKVGQGEQDALGPSSTPDEQ